MKKFLVLLSILCYGAYADTISLHWLNDDGSIYENSTCTVDGDLELPTPPTKTGYTFAGWELSPFTRIEYLESTGTQAIDTGVIITGINTDINIVMSVVSVASQEGNVPFFFGAGSPWVAYITTIGNKTSYQYSLYSKDYVGPNVTLNAKHDFRLVLNTNNAQFYVDDILYANHPNLATVNGDDKIYLFARNANGDVGYFSYMKLYRFSISMDNSLVRDFIPVLDKNSIPCLYDLVEGKFYYNAGTGDFIAGPLLNE